MSQLPIQPYPYEDESLMSYCYRLASINYCSMSTITGGLTVNDSKYVYSQDHLRMIIEKWNLSEKLCKQFWDYIYERLVAGSISSHLYRTKKFCPHCYKEKNYYRIQWLFDFTPICAKHGIYMVNQCTECNRALQQNEIFLGQCKCGKSVYEMKTSTVNDPKAISFQEVIEHNIFGTDFINIPREEGNPIFELSPDSFSIFITVLYLVIKAESQYESDLQLFPGYDISKMKNTDPFFISLIWGKVYEFICDWPWNYQGHSFRVYDLFNHLYEHDRDRFYYLHNSVSKQLKQLNKKEFKLYWMPLREGVIKGRRIK